MRAMGALVLAATVLMTVSGCGPRVREYWPTGRLVETDPATGDTVITQFWRFDNGETTVTFKRIPRGNTDTRRDAPPPAARIAD